MVDALATAAKGGRRVNNVLKFPPTDNVSLPQAIRIVKSRLHDDDISIKSRTIAIEKVANMETHNSIKKDELIEALRWIFEHYDF